MRRPDTACRALSAVLALASFVSLARAQDGGTIDRDAGSTPDAAPGAAPVDPDAVVPPYLIAFVDAGYPEAARATQREASVLMMITIGDDGFVEDATLVEPPVGDGFDELALAAARRFAFEPATRGGQPMRSRIQYRYEFKLTPPSSPTAEERPVAEARLAINVRTSEDKPIARAEIIVAKPSDPAFTLRLIADESGHVEAGGLAEGAYELTVLDPKFTSERHVERLIAGQTIELTYRLTPVRSFAEYGAVAHAKAPPREVTRRTIHREELTRVAGTRGDALRTIELLPGVSRPPFGSGLLLIRGAAPGDSQALLDGIPVPLVYHFGGLTSFIQSRILDRIDFYPGNFSARFGRHTGGIIDVGVRDSSPKDYHGVVDVNLPVDSSAYVEGPITDKASFTVGGRRSYLGNVLQLIIPKGTVDQLAAPVYYDYHGFVDYRPTDRDRLRIGGYGASDRFEVLFAKNDSDPAVKGIELHQQFHRAQIGWRRQYSAAFEHDIQLSFGHEDNVFRVPPDFDLDLSVNAFYMRAEWRYRVSRAVQVIVGTDDEVGNFKVQYRGPVFPDSEQSGAGGSFAALPTMLYTRHGNNVNVAGYLEVPLTPIKPLRIVPGMRVDYSNLIHQFSFDPRLAVIYSVREDWRVKAGVGVFSQPPDPPQALPGFGNPNLLYIKSLHYSAGVEHDFTDDISLGVEGFYKNIYQRVVGTDYQAAALRGQLDPPPFENDGIGRIYGLEVSGRKQAKGRWFGFLSYTLMRSERKDHDDPWRLFNFDQTHILTLASGVLLGRGFEVGGTFRVVTGNPRTPIIGASFDQDLGSYTPEDGKPNSIRAPTFNRLDVRGEKRWVFDKWMLALYLDIQNVYNAKNPEGVSYNFNYKEQSQIRGLPILPVLGLRGEL